MEQPVTVDHGDLLEVLQAAEAWAGSLRKSILWAHSQGLTDAKRREQTADRIDKSIHALREQSYESSHV